MMVDWNRFEILCVFDETRAEHLSPKCQKWSFQNGWKCANYSFSYCYFSHIFFFVVFCFTQFCCIFLIFHWKSSFFPLYLHFKWNPSQYLLISFSLSLIEKKQIEANTNSFLEQIIVHTWKALFELHSNSLLVVCKTFTFSARRRRTQTTTITAALVAWEKYNQLQCVFRWFWAKCCDIVCFCLSKTFAFAFRIYRCNLGAACSWSFIISKFTVHTHSVPFESLFFTVHYPRCVWSCFVAVFIVFRWITFRCVAGFFFFSFTPTLSRSYLKENGTENVTKNVKEKKKMPGKDLFVW